MSACCVDLCITQSGAAANGQTRQIRHIHTCMAASQQKSAFQPLSTRAKHDSQHYRQCTAQRVGVVMQANLRCQSDFHRVGPCLHKRRVLVNNCLEVAPAIVLELRLARISKAWSNRPTSTLDRLLRYAATLCCIHELGFTHGVCQIQPLMLHIQREHVNDWQCVQALMHRSAVGVTG